MMPSRSAQEDVEKSDEAVEAPRISDPNAEWSSAIAGNSVPCVPMDFDLTMC